MASVDNAEPPSAIRHGRDRVNRLLFQCGVH